MLALEYGTCFGERRLREAYGMFESGCFCLGEGVGMTDFGATPPALRATLPRLGEGSLQAIVGPVFRTLDEDGLRKMR